MKKFFTLAIAALAWVGGANSLFAQEEDMTDYIANAGFDTDLTFQADGAMKEIIKKSTKIGRSYAWEAADSTVYAHPDGTCDNNPRKDGLWESATNGFIGRVQGWTIETNQQYPKCEWVYFGTIPYDLQEKAIPIADNGSSFLEVPAKPDADNGDDNVGFAYLRAGWGGRAVYKQTVKLPCAQYRLEYWAININPNGTNGKNLSKVTCRRDTWADETGFSDTEWTLHTIEFTPTADFTMEFGFESSGGSGSNPFLCIDGIKLYKIGEASEEELLEEDLYYYQGILGDLMQNDTIAAYSGLVTYLETEFEEADKAAGDIDAMNASIAHMKEVIEKTEALKTTLVEYAALVAEVEKILAGDTHEGADALEQALDNVTKQEASATPDDYAGMIEALNQAITDYNFAQVATMDNPADYTFLVQTPYFTTKAASPTITFADNGSVETCVYPEDAELNSGSAPAIGSSTGWYKAGTTDGDQRLNFISDRVCWNAWRANSQDVAVAQDLTGLPNGYYKVSAELITQPDYVSNQHVFANSTVQKVSSPALEAGLWDEGTWTTLTTDLVLVADGKLTIGALGSALEGSTNQTGWFCVTNFRLQYYGEAEADALDGLYAAKLTEATEVAGNVQFAADKTQFEAVIAAYNSAADFDAIVVAMDTLNKAQTEAEKSITEYNNVVNGTYAELKKNIEEQVYSTNQGLVAQTALNNMDKVLVAADASYKTVGTYTARLRAYRDNYLPVLGTAETTTVQDATAKEALEVTIAAQVDLLANLDTIAGTEVLDILADKLNAAIATAQATDLIVSGGDNIDVTSLIVNPQVAQNAAGWVVNKPVGDGNGAKSGQQYDGGDGYYFDSYNGTAGALRFTVSQTIDNIPNGIYALKAKMRASGTPGEEGVYLFAINGVDTANAVFAAAHMSALPLDGTYGVFPTEEEEAAGTEVRYTSDTYGEIWMEAYNKMNVEGDESEEIQNIVEANTSLGRGWFYNSLQIEVTKNVLTIGVTCDSVLTKGHVDTTGKECTPFTGTWYSADDFELVLVENKEPNFNPATGVEAIEQKNAYAEKAIYNLAGQRIVRLQKGINIVDGKKIFVK